MMADGARVQVRRGERVRDGGCQACTRATQPEWVWVVLLGDPEGNRVEVRLCNEHLTEVVDQAGVLACRELAQPAGRSRCICHGPDMVAGVCPVHRTPSPLAGGGTDG